MKLKPKTHFNVIGQVVLQYDSTNNSMLPAKSRDVK